MIKGRPELWVLAAFVLLGLGGLAGAQEPPQRPEPPEEHFMPPLPERLEELIEIAMHQNPDIALAEAQIREAAAHLRQVKLGVIQELTEVHHQRRGLHEALEMIARKVETGVAPWEERAEVQRRQVELDARTRYLLGMGIGMPMEAELDGMPRPPQEPLIRVPRPQGFEAYPWREVLETPFPIHENTTLGALLETVSASVDVNVVIDLEVDSQAEIRFAGRAELPLRSLLLALTDQIEYLAFVARDYGILATHRERAQRIDAPAIPGNLPLYVQAPPPPHGPRPPQEGHARGRGTERGDPAMPVAEGDVRRERAPRRDREGPPR